MGPQGRTHTIWVGWDQESKRKQEEAKTGTRMTKVQYKEWQKEKSKEWKSCVPTPVKNLILSENRANKLQAAITKQDGEVARPSRKGVEGKVMRTFTDEYGTEQSPVDPKLFSQHIRKDR